MAQYEMTEEEFLELEQKVRCGEALTAMESFRLRKEQERRHVPRNALEELSAAYRRGPFAERE